MGRYSSRKVNFPPFLTDQTRAQPTSCLGGSRIALGHFSLDSTLLGLAIVMLLLGSGLSVGIASQSSHGAADCATDTVSKTTAQVLELTLRFLSLALLVLLSTLLLQILGANQVSDHFLKDS
jgi:hypothetical protein